MGDCTGMCKIKDTGSSSFTDLVENSTVESCVAGMRSTDEVVLCVFFPPTSSTSRIKSDGFATEKMGEITWPPGPAGALLSSNEQDVTVPKEEFFGIL